MRIKKLFKSLMMVVLAVVCAAPAAAYADEPDLPDLSSKRLIVAGDAGDEAHLLSSFGGVSLLQYETEEEAANAWLRYRETAAFTDVDSVIFMADEAFDQTVGAVPSEMDRERNPVSALERLLNEEGNEEADPDENERKTAALLDTGVNTETARAVAFRGEGAGDENGHGTRTAETMYAENRDIRIISEKVFGENGEADVSSVWAALKYAIAKKAEVIHLSLSAADIEAHPALQAVLAEAAENRIAVSADAENTVRLLDSAEEEQNDPSAGRPEQSEDRTGDQTEDQTDADPEVPQSEDLKEEKEEPTEDHEDQDKETVDELQEEESADDAGAEEESAEPEDQKPHAGTEDDAETGGSEIDGEEPASEDGRKDDRDVPDRKQPGVRLRAGSTDTATVKVTLNDDSGAGVAGAVFKVCPYSAEKGGYSAAADGFVMTDKGNGSYTLKVTRTDDNSGRFRIRQSEAPAGYLLEDTAYRYIRMQDGATQITVPVSGGSDLVWTDKKVSYTLVLDANGGHVNNEEASSVTASERATGSTELLAGVSYTLRNCYYDAPEPTLNYPEFMREGYVFRGWNTWADGSGTQYGTGTQITIKDPVSENGTSLVLYAQWAQRIGTTQELTLANGASVRPVGFGEYRGIDLIIPYQKQGQSVKMEGSEDFALAPPHTGYNTGTGTNLYYDRPLSAGITSLEGESVSIILPERANDIYGNLYDVKVTLSDIVFNAEKDLPAGVRMMSVDKNGRAVISAISDNLDGTIGAKYNIRISILNPDGTEADRMKTLLYFQDMDVYDRFAEGTQPRVSGSSVLPFTEAIHVPLSTASVFYTDLPEQNAVFAAADGDGRTAIAGTEYTGEESAKNGQIPASGQSMSAVSFEAFTDSMEFSWTGNRCGTSLFMLAKSWTIESNVVGDYPKGGTITRGGDGEIPFPHRTEDVHYTAEAAEGYRISGMRLTVYDNANDLWTEPVDLEIPENAREYTYVFDSVETNYRIEVEFVPWEGTVTVRKESTFDGQTLAGAEFTVYPYSAADGEYSSEGTAMVDLGGGVYRSPLTWNESNRGWFRIEETKAPEHHRRSDIMRYIHLTEDGQSIVYGASSHEGDASEELVWKNDPEAVSVIIEAEKIFRNGELKGNDFEFVLKDKNGRPITENVRNDKAGAVRFGPIALDPSDEALLYETDGGSRIYRWFIAEIPGDSRSVTYAEQEEEVRVIVQYDAEHKLTAEVRYDEDGAVFVNKKRVTVPTGLDVPDPRSLIPVLAVLAAAAGLIVFLGRRRNRRSEGRKRNHR